MFGLRAKEQVPIRRSWPVDLQPSRRDVGDRVEIVGVRGDDEIVASSAPSTTATSTMSMFAGACREGTNGRAWSSSSASTSQPKVIVRTALAGAASPGLRDDGSGRDGDRPPGEQSSIARPRASLSPVRRDERAGVVGDAHYALLRRRAPDASSVRRRRRPTVRLQASLRR